MTKHFTIIIIFISLKAQSQESLHYFIEKNGIDVTYDTIYFSKPIDLYLNFSEIANNYFFTFATDKDFENIEYDEFYYADRREVNDTFRSVYLYENKFNYLQNSLEKIVWKETKERYRNKHKHYGYWYIFNQRFRIKKSDSEIIEYSVDLERRDTTFYTEIKKQSGNKIIWSTFRQNKLISEKVLLYERDRVTREIFDFGQSNKIRFKIIKEYSNKNLISETTYNYSNSNDYKFINTFNSYGNIAKQEKYTIDGKQLLMVRYFYY